MIQIDKELCIQNALTKFYNFISPQMIKTAITIINPM